MSGKKNVGCCVHVAAVISYLAFQKYESFKPKAQYLQRIFIDTEEGESPNITKNIRSKKRKIDFKRNLYSDSSDSDSQIEISSNNISLDHENVSGEIFGFINN